MDGDRLKTAAGFVAAVALLAVVIWYIGFDEVVTALLRGDPRVAALTLPVAVVWLSAWGLSLYTVLRALGAPIRPHKAVFVFTAAVFSNNITPFGQAGGEPVSAMFISSASDSEYETGLAAIASVDTLHFIPSLAVAAVGLGYVAVTAAEFTQDLVFAVTAAAALAAVVPTVGYLVWRYRERLKRVVVDRLGPGIQFLGRVVPIASPPSRDVIEKRVEGFFSSVGRVASNRRALVTAMSLSALGWVCLSTSLWLSLAALGHVIPFLSILFVVPIGSIAGVTPFPGGLGGIEAAFVTLLLPLGVPAEIATAAVLIHRGATYWLPTAFGGGAAFILGAQARRTRQ
ncbi:MAG: lysylphosphatidylglycerol synthase transmembrane domain-containing protein [Haloarculaceae archaeon]